MTTPTPEGFEDGGLTIDKKDAILWYLSKALPQCGVGCCIGFFANTLTDIVFDGASWGSSFLGYFHIVAIGFLCFSVSLGVKVLIKLANSARAYP